MRNDSWEWYPGKVDLINRYFELKYGNDPSPVARIGIGEYRNFTVEFLININDDNQRLKEIFKEIIWEIEMYLINNSEPDPIEYMIKHTRKCANLYSRVHWNYFPKGYKHAISSNKESNLKRSSNTFNKFFSKLIN
jgi:hypothetical protein